MANKRQKTCFIVRRYFIKRTGSVCCVVRNGRDEEYITCIHADGTTACDCDSRKGKCYHRDHVKAAEQVRKQRSATTAPVPQVTTLQQVVKQTVRPVVSRPAMIDAILKAQLETIPGRGLTAEFLCSGRISE